ncbi:phosphotransferase family protein [Kitasatospora sp. NPDC057904]|uniref:phosphotransferase family protein n=1 Tax=unclassified Kitasatospora TaxID=2633591 RepID=UPI0036DE82FC
MTVPALPDDADRLLRSTAGPYEPLGVHSRNRAGQPAVWEVRTGDGRRMFAKRPKNELMHRRETAAYRGLVPALGPGRAPTLLAEDVRSLLLVTATLPGTPVISAALSAAEECEVYRQAGLLAARIHAHPIADGVFGKRLPWSQERERALARARDAQLSKGDVKVLAEATRAELPKTAIATCHGDCGPRNWLVCRSGDGRLFVGVIDFERSQVKEPVRRDLMRVMLQLTPHRPDLRTAFLTGYGRDLTTAEQAACRAWAAIDCPAALRWPSTTTTTKRLSDTPASSWNSYAAPQRPSETSLRSTILEVAPWKAFARQWP